MIRDVRDPAGLQARLRAAGVPAVVRVASPACGQLVSPTPAPYSDETYRALTQTYSQYLRGWLYVVHPDAIKPGHTLAIMIQGGRSENPSVTSDVLATSHPLCRPAPKLPALPAPTATAPSYVVSDVPSAGPSAP